MSCVSWNRPGACHGHPTCGTIGGSASSGKLGTDPSLRGTVSAPLGALLVPLFLFLPLRGEEILLGVRGDDSHSEYHGDQTTACSFEGRKGRQDRMKWRFLKADHFHTWSMERVLLHKCANERILLVYKGNKMARVRQNQIHEMLRLSDGGHLIGIGRGVLLKRTEIPDLV